MSIANLGVAVACVVVGSLHTTASVAANSPPVITIELPPNPGWFYEDGQIVRIRLTVTDPDGDLVSANLSATPTWHGFRPIVDEPSGAPRELLWYLAEVGGGFHDLTVRAWDDFQPDRIVIEKHPLLVLSANKTQRVLTHDFGGDPAEDLVASAS